MGDILIKGMDMPKSCDNCWFEYAYEICKSEYENCPLVEIPSHGRLIDADALEELVIKQKYACASASAHGLISELYKSWGLHDAELMIEAVLTIIPAEEDDV